MAGDWIKFEHVTPDKPEVISMAGVLDIDQDSVVGKLVRIWVWADQNSVDGNAMSVTDTFLDRLVFQIGFAKALRQVGWLSGKNGKLTLPKFERHNGETAKKRASTNRRVAKSRIKKDTENKGVTNNCNTNVTPKALQKALPEKRREEKSTDSKLSVTPKSPKGDWVEIYPDKCFSKSKTEQKQIKVIKNNEKMCYIGKWFGRSEETLWNVKEAKTLEKLNPSRDDVKMLENYYTNQIDSKPLRQSVEALLNNWSGELDRANTHSKKPPERDSREFKENLTAPIL